MDRHNSNNINKLKEHQKQKQHLGVVTNSKVGYFENKIIENFKSNPKPLHAYLGTYYIYNI